MLAIFFIIEGLSLLVELLRAVAEYVVLQSQRAAAKTQEIEHDNPVLQAPGRMMAAWKRLPERLRSFVLSRTVVWSLIAFGTVLYGSLPGEDISYLDAAYMTAVTGTTLGLGDVAPTTLAGQILTLFWIPFTCSISECRP